MHFKITPNDMKLFSLESMYEHICCRDDIQKELNSYLADELDSVDKTLSNYYRACARDVLKRSGFKQKPASQYVREAICSRIKKKHKHLCSRILTCLLNNPEVIDLDNTNRPLNDIEKRGLTTLIKTVYGGCVHSIDKISSFEPVRKIASYIYSISCFHHIRVGCIAERLKVTHFPTIGINTIRKILKEYAPDIAQTFGRNSKSDINAIDEFIKKECSSVF